MNVRTLRFAATSAILLSLRATAIVPVPAAAPPGENIITCGEPPLQETYCYNNSEATTWLYTSADGTTPLALIFSAGQIESDSWDHLTIYDGPNNASPVLWTHAGVFSTQDLTGVLAISTGPSIFMELSTDGSVSCASGSFISWAWAVGCLDCVQPQASFDIDLMCDLGIFNVVVDITAMGSDPSIDITNNGGAATVTATSTGTYTVGPFTQGTVVEVVLENELNSLCNVSSGPVTNFPCPIISCGPDQYTHCYGNSENFIQVFQGNTGWPIRLQFNSGSIYQWDGDLLTIYDGLNDQAPVLYQGTGNNGDLTGMYFTSTNPDFALSLKMTSTQFTSCADGSALTWDYTVGCLDCTPPAGTAGTVTTDCDAQIFSVSVDVTDLGTDPELEIGNDLGYPPTMVTTPGTYTAGPFPVGAPVTLTLVNDANALCNVELGVFENAFCPIIIPCANPALDQTYCYENSDANQWLYQDNEGMPLALVFQSGTIESSSFDHLSIYDGVDQNGILLWSHTTFTTIDLSTLPPMIAPSGSIYMTMSSDGSVSCSSGSQTTWNWTVDCLDCQPVTATAGEVTTDCAAQTWSVSVEVSALGNDPSVELTNDIGLPPTVITAPGTYTAGPFPVGTPVNLVLVNDSNSLCNVNLGTFENAFCPIIIDCSAPPIQDNYCYGASDFHHWLYASNSGAPVVIQFLQGTIESNTWDHLDIYDGSDNTGTLLWSHNTFTTIDLTDTTVVSISDSIYMEMSSDASISCSSGSQTEWIWNVFCLDCTPPVAAFEMVPDCIHNGFTVDVNVTEMGQNTTDLIIRNTFDGDTITGVQPGTYTVGPFSVGDSGTVVVESVNTPLCRQVSPVFYLAPDSCVTVACDALGQEYCYTNADTAWFVYTSGTTEPITINFGYGQLLVNDYIQVYNGLDTTAQIVYMGNQGGDLEGLAISSSNPDNALTLLVISSQMGSCATGQTTQPIYWSVGCGLVGVNEFTVDGFAMFPNPTNGELYIRMADGHTGMVNIDVLDITGRMVMSERFNATAGRTERFDLGALTNGNYAVRLYTDSWSKTQQLQVAR